MFIKNYFKQLYTINKRPLNNEEFIAKVWKWKYAGIFTWVSVCYLIYTIFSIALYKYLNPPISITGDWSMIYLYPIVFLTITLPLYFYSLSLNVVPVRKNVLTLKEFKNPSLFYLTEFIWLFLHLMMYLSNIQHVFIISILILFLLFLYLDFSVILVNFIVSNKKGKSVNRFSIFKEHCIFKVPLLPLFIIFFYFYYISQLYTGIIVISTIYISFLFTSICSLIIGEKVSFATIDNGSRLEYGISNRSEIVRFWAYCNFYDIVSPDSKPSRRSFFYANNGQIDDIIDDMIDMINMMAEKHELIDSSKFEVKNLSTSTTKRRFKEKLKLPFYAIRNFFRRRWSNTMKMMKERNAVSNSVIAMMAVESLKRLLYLSETEDKIGKVQKKSESILNSIINLYRACNRTQNLTWMTPPFGFRWIANDYQKLTVLVEDIAYEAAENLAVSFGYRFDIYSIKRENKNIFKSFVKYGSRS